MWALCVLCVCLMKDEECEVVEVRIYLYETRGEKEKLRRKRGVLCVRECVMVQLVSRTRASPFAPLSRA